MIPDPCAKIIVLFQLKHIISIKPDLKRNVKSQGRLLALNDLIENEIGLEDHEKHFQTFLENLAEKKSSPISQTKTFTLECILKHRNNYQILCP